MVLHGFVMVTSYDHMNSLMWREKCDTDAACAIPIKEIKKEAQKAAENPQHDAGKENAPGKEEEEGRLGSRLLLSDVHSAVTC